MSTRLKLDDPSLFPVQAFFNAIGDASFVQVIDHLTSRVGYSINDADCTFPADLDPGDEPFDGVRFSLFEEDKVISIEQLNDYVRRVCDAHRAHHPEDEERIEQLLGRI